MVESRGNKMYTRRRAEGYSSDEAFDARRFGQIRFPYILENCRVSERLFPNQARNDLNLPPVHWRDLDEKLTPSDGDRIDRDFVGEPRITNYQCLRCWKEGGKKIFCRMNGIQLPNLTILTGICSVVKLSPLLSIHPYMGLQGNDQDFASWWDGESVIALDIWREAWRDGI